MTQATQVDGELLAKAVAERAKALDTLENSKASASYWHYLLLVTMGVAWGWVTSNYGTTFNDTLVAIVAGAGFLLAANGYREAITARRRIDALVVLTKANSAL